MQQLHRMVVVQVQWDEFFVKSAHGMYKAGREGAILLRWPDCPSYQPTDEGVGGNWDQPLPLQVMV